MSLKTLKLRVLSLAAHSGIERLALDSAWRQQRLLILCYHGISLRDEHLWNPALYIGPELLRRRFERLRDCHVLPLSEALARLWAGTLPRRAVALTFDDGTYDFFAAALPLLKEFGYPATVYFTTYYSEFNRPVFDVMVDYLLWRAGPRVLDFPPALPSPVMLDTGGRQTAHQRIKTYAAAERFCGRQKDDLLASLAERLGVDFSGILRARILHLMNPDEARQAAAAGIDFGLHTHRHRVSRQKSRFLQELADNRARIRSMTLQEPVHFCYPGGFVLPEFAGWLKEAGVASATTCRPGVCSQDSNPWLLPRFVDSATTTMLEFGGWLSGLSSLLPKRSHVMSAEQLLETGEAGS